MLMLLAGVFGAIVVGSIIEPPLDTLEDDDDTPSQDRETNIVPIEGSEEDDVLSGTDEGDFIDAKGENDVASGMSGNDTLLGGAGVDVLDGGDGDDQLYGGEDSDQLYGQNGNDTLAGEAGDDKLLGGLGDDSLAGGKGSDHLVGGFDNDTLDGGEGDDSLQGGWGNDVLAGGEGNDALAGGSGNDVLVGSDEDLAMRDYLNGADGDDHLILGASDIGSGGTGNDTFEIDLTNFSTLDAPVEILDFTNGEDTITISYDPAEGAAPDVTVMVDPNNAENALILVNSKVVATLQGAEGLTADDINLIPEGTETF